MGKISIDEQLNKAFENLFEGLWDETINHYLDKIVEDKCVTEEEIKDKRENHIGFYEAVSICKDMNKIFENPDTEIPKFLKENPNGRDEILKVFLLESLLDDAVRTLNFLLSPSISPFDDKEDGDEIRKALKKEGSGEAKSVYVVRKDCANEVLSKLKKDFPDMKIEEK